MAFTITMMSWSIVEYGKQMAASGELGHAMEAVKWGTDYLIKAHPEPNVFYGEVGFFPFSCLLSYTLFPFSPLPLSSPHNIQQSFLLFFIYALVSLSLFFLL